VWCRFDHILLETTGLANPGPVAAVLWVDDQLESPVRLDSIVTVCVSLGIHPPIFACTSGVDNCFLSPSCFCSCLDNQSENLHLVVFFDT
jgi:hypothetical protein